MHVSKGKLWQSLAHCATSEVSWAQAVRPTSSFPDGSRCRIGWTKCSTTRTSARQSRVEYFRVYLHSWGCNARQTFLHPKLSPQHDDMSIKLVHRLRRCGAERPGGRNYIETCYMWYVGNAWKCCPENTRKCAATPPTLQTCVSSNWGCWKDVNLCCTVARNLRLRRPDDYLTYLDLIWR